ncbi:MAG TPA: hypothetical protein VH437_07485 [Terriglobales bacterium]|jgi:hypothetical protein
MDPALRVVKLIRIAMLVSVVLYVVIAEMAAPKSAAPPNLIIFYVLTFMAITSVILIMGFRRFWIVPAAAALPMPVPDAAINRWRTGYILAYAFAETIALYGLVLRFLGFSLSQVAPFYLAAFVLLMMLAPQWPASELS